MDLKYSNLDSTVKSDDEVEKQPNVENFPLAPSGTAANSDFLVAAAITTLIIFIFSIANPESVHWLLVPIFFCGVLIGADASLWLRKKINLLDPIGLIGSLGFIHFVAAPLLLLYLRLPGAENYVVADWRPLIGTMAILNLFGILLYRLFQNIVYRWPTKSELRYWKINFKKAGMVLPIILPSMFFAYVVFLIKAGGFSGLLIIERQGVVSYDLSGLGPFMFLRSSLPIIIFISITLFRLKQIKQKESYFIYIFFFIGFAAFHFLTVGLSGSRSSTIYGLFWAAGIIHIFWRKIKLKWVLLSIIPLIIFAYLYGFYKVVGLRALDVISGSITINQIEEKSGRNLGLLIIGDMSRAQIQPIILDALIKKGSEYRYRLGSTYFTSIIPYIPRIIWPGKPTDSGKVIAGTELLYGPGSYRSRSDLSGGYRATAIYGLAGEAMLNFGVVGVPIVFCIFGSVVGKIRKKMHTYSSGDTRLLFSPFLTIFCLLIFTHDMTNVFAVTLFYFFLPALVIFFISDKKFVSDHRVEKIRRGSR